MSLKEFQHFCTVQVRYGLGQNKFLSTVLPVCFDPDLERWGQAFHSKSLSIGLLIYLLVVQYHCKFTRELDLKTERISIFTSWLPPVERSKGLLIPKITAPSKTPVDSPSVVTAMTPLMGEKQSSSQKLLRDLFRHLQPTKLRECEGDVEHFPPHLH